MGKRSRSTIKVRESHSTQTLKQLPLRMIGAWGIIIILITFLIYVPALKNDFVNWDDDVYVYKNNYIHSLQPQAIAWMLTAFHVGNWHPLTWLSHAADYAIWGLNPFGHHLSSIILHVLNTLLVFLLTLQLIRVAKKSDVTPSRSSPLSSTSVQSLIGAGITALLFGVHPLHVESVAWVAERKDLLCALFFLLTLCSYLFYTSSAHTKNRRFWFTACLALTSAALMAKPMAVTLPLVLLLLDIYPLRRISSSTGAGSNPRVLLEKVPFLLLSSISSILTVLAQHEGGAFKGLERPLHLKLANALYAPFFYLAKMIWPGGLVPFYPFPKVLSSTDFTRYVISAILLVSITGVGIWAWKRGRPLFLNSWAYYLITLLPVVGIVQVGVQAAADRYTYLPSISIFLLAGLGISQLAAVWLRSKAMLMSGALIIVLIFATLMQMTLKQTAIWRDSETLWNHVIKSFPGRVHFAHFNLANDYMRKKEYDKAIAEYETAIAILPAYSKAINNLGNVYLNRGDYDKALEKYEKAIAIDPDVGEAHNNLGLVYYAKGKYGLAKNHIDRALALGYKVNPKLLELIKTARTD